MKSPFRVSLLAGACLFPALLTSGCAGSAPPAPPSAADSLHSVELDAFFLRFRQKIQGGSADSLVPDLSRESIRWMEDIRRAARTEPPAFLKDRPFAEILCVLALRVQRRLDPAFDDRIPGLVDRLVMRAAPVRKAFLKSELGPARVRGGEGSIGLKEAPRVPVFHFTRENGLWRFHIARSLPLILQGAESLARQRKPTKLEQAVWLLEQFGGQRVLAEDLNR